MRSGESAGTWYTHVPRSYVISWKAPRCKERPEQFHPCPVWPCIVPGASGRYASAAVCHLAPSYIHNHTTHTLTHIHIQMNSSALQREKSIWKAWRENAEKRMSPPFRFDNTIFFVLCVYAFSHSQLAMYVVCACVSEYVEKCVLKGGRWSSFAPNWINDAMDCLAAFAVCVCARCVFTQASESIPHVYS